MGDHVVLPFTGATGLLVSGRGSVTFINFAETSGAAAAAVELYDGTTTGGVYLCRVQMAANGTQLAGLGRGQLTFRRGIYASVVTGTIKGSIAALLTPSDPEWAALQAVWDSSV